MCSLRTRSGCLWRWSCQRISRYGAWWRIGQNICCSCGGRNWCGKCRSQTPVALTNHLIKVRRRRHMYWRAWRTGLVAMVVVCVTLLCTSHAVWADTDVGNVAVLETDPTILLPGELFDLNGQTVTLTPQPGGGTPRAWV